MSNRTITALSLDGGALCLDFVNTVSTWASPERHDHVQDYTDLLLWCRRQPAFAEAYVAALEARAAREPARAGEILPEFRAVRQVLFDLFAAIANQMPPEAATVDTFNRYLAEALAKTRLVFAEDAYHLALAAPATDLREPLWFILQSAADVLAHEDRRRLKKCPECDWVFLDRTKNGGRIWCNPAVCGSTTKARRYYQKKKQSGTEA